MWKRACKHDGRGLLVCECGACDRGDGHKEDVVLGEPAHGPDAAAHRAHVAERHHVPLHERGVVLGAHLALHEPRKAPAEHRGLGQRDIVRRLLGAAARLDRAVAPEQQHRRLAGLGAHARLHAQHPDPAQCRRHRRLLWSQFAHSPFSVGFCL